MAIKPISVSQLNSYVKRVLQSDPLLGNVTVVGEISNLKYHSTGHVYFTLKDQNSKLSCFLPADQVRSMRYELSDGMEINASGYIYLFERGGTYSLNIRDISVAGVGNLSLAFEKLKEKLAGEGLFDEKVKKPLPFFPRKIAVVTSETGAAVKDIVKIIKNRNTIVDVLIFPCQVQGPAAAGEIASAIGKLNEEFSDLDLMIVGRGGGSMEELWAFNEEVVARSIFSSRIPIISAVGHETDVTIADFVADRRAETPTAAAQMAVPHIGELKSYIDLEKSHLIKNLKNILKYAEMKIESNNISALRMILQNRMQMETFKLDALKATMDNSVENLLKDRGNRLDSLLSTLEQLNPVRIMEKGYVALTDLEGGLISSANGLQKGQSVQAIFRDGKAKMTVDEIYKETDDGQKKRSN